MASSNNNNANSNNQESNEKKDLDLASISYAEYVLLSSTLAYAIADELNDADLDMMLAFFGMLVSDLAILRTSRGINNAKQAVQAQQAEGAAISGAETSVNAGDIIASDLSRDLPKKKKCIRRVKKKKKKKNF